MNAKQTEDQLRAAWQSVCDSVAWPDSFVEKLSRSEIESYAKGARRVLEYLCEHRPDDETASQSFKIDQNDMIGALGEWSRRKGEEKPTRFPSINKTLNQIRDWRIALNKENKREIWQQLRPIQDDLWRWTTTRKVENDEKLEAYQLACHEARSLNDLILCR